MAKNKMQKKALLEEYRATLKSSEAVIFVRQSGIKVNQVTTLRKELYQMDVKVCSVKNTLIRKVMSENSFTEIQVRNGSFLSFFISRDLIHVVKILKKAIADIKATSEKIVASVEFGIFQNQILTPAQILELADVPDKITSIAMILGIIESSVAGIVAIIDNPVKSYLSIMDHMRR